MRGNRTKYDWSKPFKLIDSKRAFDQIETTQDMFPTLNSAEEGNKQGKKQEIIVPKIETVKRVTEPKSFAKISMNYIRLPAHLNLPKLVDYELTEVDHVFVQGHCQKYKFNGKIILTPQFLTKTFIQLQTKAGKDLTLPRSKGWMMSFLQRQYKQLLKMQNVEQFAEMVYNYWKSRREQLKFPLLRPLWRPNPDEYNHLLAFKVRQKQKRNLRRANRIQQDDILQQLQEQFDLALKIAQRVQFREQMKYKQAQVQFAMFYAECKPLLSSAELYTELNSQNRSKDRDKLKKYNQGVESCRSKRQSEKLDSIIPQTTQQPFDAKMSLINFLATVVAEAEPLGITYDRIFYPSVNPIQVQDKDKDKNKPYPPGPFIPPIPPPQDIPQMQQEHLQISLKRAGDLIIRSFDQESQDEPWGERIGGWLEYKRQKVSRYYFGDDDDGENKDIRKNIAMSFKKYQQMNSVGIQK